ncbi:MAG: integration host factor subunit beta [Gammaproteobacteria bacterium]
MTRSELIEYISRRYPHLPQQDIELAIKTLLDRLGWALAEGRRIEIRGFGSFSLHYHRPRLGRNPKTGETVALPGRFVPHFKPGKSIRQEIEQSKAPIRSD